MMNVFTEWFLIVFTLGACAGALIVLGIWRFCNWITTGKY